MPTFPEKKFKEWFLKEKRALPWRENRLPYSVWISEVMLQQTRAQVVVSYYKQWLQEFPTIRSLAEAPIEKVIKVWEGLGYYSRARNLHRGAHYLVEQHGGELPSSYEELIRVPGIGPYTAGAIASFAFGKKAAALDGNVMRVLSRFFLIEEIVDLPKTQEKLREHLLTLLPEEAPELVMEGLIELGALVCGKAPYCLSCPLKGECRAFAEGVAEGLPRKRVKEPIVKLHRHLFLVRSQGAVLLRMGGKGQIMEGLYEFPYVEASAEASPEDLFRQWWEEEAVLVGVLPQEKHTFTRYRVTLTPSVWESERQKGMSGYEWWPAGKLRELPFSSGHRRVLERDYDVLL